MNLGAMSRGRSLRERAFSQSAISRSEMPQCGRSGLALFHKVKCHVACVKGEFAKVPEERGKKNCPARDFDWFGRGSRYRKGRAPTTDLAGQKNPIFSDFFASTPQWARTTNLRFRRPMLYPIELGVQMLLFGRCQSLCWFLTVFRRFEKSLMRLALRVLFSSAFSSLKFTCLCHQDRCQWLPVRHQCWRGG